MLHQHRPCVEMRHVPVAEAFVAQEGAVVGEARPGDAASVPTAAAVEYLPPLPPGVSGATTITAAGDCRRVPVVERPRAPTMARSRATTRVAADAATSSRRAFASRLKCRTRRRDARRRVVPEARSVDGERVAHAVERRKQAIVDVQHDADGGGAPRDVPRQHVLVRGRRRRLASPARRRAVRMTAAASPRITPAVQVAHALGRSRQWSGADVGRADAVGAEDDCPRRRHVVGPERPLEDRVVGVDK